MAAAVDCFKRPLLLGSERLGMRHGMAVCIQVLVWIASRVEAHGEIICTPDGHCVFAGNGTVQASTTARVEKNSKYIAFGIVAGIVVLVVVNLIICIARCIFSPRLLQVGANQLFSRNVEDGSASSGGSRFKSVYVMNPGGSLKIGRRDSKKGLETSGGDECAVAADACEQGFSQASEDEEQQIRSYRDGVDHRFDTVFPRD